MIDSTGPVTWTCHPRAIRCPAGHVYRLRDEGMHRDHRAIAGHEFFRCERCEPPSYWFTVFTTTPDRHANCYLVSEESWRSWQGLPDSEMGLSTLEMLFLIRSPTGENYNPTFRKAP